MRRFRPLALTAALLAVAGCGEAPGEPDRPARQTAGAEVAPVVKGAERGRIILDGSGLAVRDAAGVARTIAFGRPAASAVAAARQLYGEPHSVETLEECGAGPLQVSRFSGLTLAAQDGKFAGWLLDGRYEPPLPTTERGIGIGSTREALDAAYSIEAFESSLGDEFTTDGLAGLLAGEGKLAKVTHLWAGATCIMR